MLVFREKIPQLADCEMLWDGLVCQLIDTFMGFDQEKTIGRTIEDRRKKSEGAPSGDIALRGELPSHAPINIH